MNADGTDETRLTDSDGEDIDPSWSPDGEKIAFASNRDENLEIYVMDANDGDDVTRLTDNDVGVREPDWGTNTLTPSDDGDGDKNKHDDKKKHHDDHAKKKS